LFTILCDGMAKQGLGAWAIVVLKNDKYYYQESGTKKNVTHNFMEWEAVRRAIDYIYKQKIKKATIYTDSLLVVNQFNMIYDVKNRSLLSTFTYCRKMVDKIDGKIEVVKGSRSITKQADTLARITWRVEKE